MGLVFLNRKPTNEDKKNLWIAKWGKNNESIEIRRTIEGSVGSAQILIIVYKNRTNIKWADVVKNQLLRDEYYKGHKDITISMNGTCDFTLETFFELDEVVTNAINILKG